MAVLRQQYPLANLAALKTEIVRVTALALNERVVINARSGEGSSHSGELVFTRMEYLGVLIDLQREIDPDFVEPPTGNAVRYANHGCRYVE